MAASGNIREMIRPAEYARRRGVARATVTKAIRRCRIPLVDGLLDPLVADTLWKARTDPDQAARSLAQNRRHDEPAAAPLESTDDWRRRRDAAEAQIAELNLRKLAGELLERVAVEREIGRRLAALQVQFDALPDRAAAALGVSDEHRRKVRAFLLSELAQIRLEAVRLGDEVPA